MAFVADLHLHSRFARACSRDLNIPNLSLWAQYKGIDLLGSGDCLHPLWLSELKSTLKETSNGYEYEGVNFLPTTEVACIYSESGKVRRIHIIIIFPSLEAAELSAEALIKRGVNLASDGRPILGLSSRALSELIWKVCPQALIIPSHIWTPWFSLFGSNSGYDSFEDCFGEYSSKVMAVETGLSSEPAMNWRIADLDQKAIVSFSDAHSLPRLGREVTIFNGEISFEGLSEAIKQNDLIGTIEFFPEEGKYHYSGHRNCGVVYGPEELKAKGKVCPKCQRELTVGVLQRVEELASRGNDELRIKNDGGIITSEAFPQRPGFRMLVQLEEIIAESMGTAVASQKVKNEYIRLVTSVDPELKLLTKTKLELISMAAGEKLAEGIERVRKGQLSITPGFDNTYGIVKIWSDEEEKIDAEQIELF